MEDIVCEICLYHRATQWLLPCKNSARCGRGRHIFCMDSLKVPNEAPMDLSSYPALLCSDCCPAASSGPGPAGKKRVAAAAPGGSKKTGQRGTKASSPAAAPSMPEAPPQQQQAAQIGAATGQQPRWDPAAAADAASSEDREDVKFGSCGRAIQPEALLDLSAVGNSSAAGGDGCGVGRTDLGRSQTSSCQLDERASSGAWLGGSGSLQQSHTAGFVHGGAGAAAAAVEPVEPAMTAAATGQQLQQASFDFSFASLASDPVCSAGCAAVCSGPVTTQGSNGSAGQQAAATSRAAALAAGCETTGPVAAGATTGKAATAAGPIGAVVEPAPGDSSSGEEDSRPIKRPKLQCGSRPSKPVSVMSARRLASGVHSSESQPPQQQSQPGAKAAASTGEGKDTWMPAPVAAAAGEAAQGEEPRGGKPGGLLQKFKGLLKQPGRTTQLTEGPLPELLSRGRKKLSGTAGTVGGLLPPTVAGTATRVSATVDRQLRTDPELSVFDDLNSPPAKGGTAPGPSMRVLGGGRLPSAGPGAVSAGPATATGKQGGPLPAPGQAAAPVGVRPQAPLGGQGRGAAAASSAALAGRLPNKGPLAGFRMGTGVLPAARRTATFDITKAFSSKLTSSMGAGPSVPPMQMNGSTQGSMLDGMNSLQSLESSQAEAANSDRAANTANQGRRVDMWDCDVPLAFEGMTLPKGAAQSLKLIMQSISPHESMVRLCSLLKTPGVLQGGLTWRLLHGGLVPPTIKETGVFYQENVPCETCLVMYPKRVIGTAYYQFQDLLNNLKDTSRFLVLEVPHLTPEKVAHDPILVRLLHSLRVIDTGGAAASSSIGLNGPFRLYFVPHSVPLDGVNFDNGVKECLLCLTGSRKHIYLMSVWDRTPATERGVRGILKLTKPAGMAPRNRVTFDTRDRNDHAEGRLLREKDGHEEGRLLREKEVLKDHVPQDSAAVGQGTLEAPDWAEEADSEPVHTITITADSGRVDAVATSGTVTPVGDNGVEEAAVITSMTAAADIHSKVKAVSSAADGKRPAADTSSTAVAADTCSKVEAAQAADGMAEAAGAHHKVAVVNAGSQALATNTGDDDGDTVIAGVRAHGRLAAVGRGCKVVATADTLTYTPSADTGSIAAAVDMGAKMVATDTAQVLLAADDGYNEPATNSGCKATVVEAGSNMVAGAIADSVLVSSTGSEVMPVGTGGKLAAPSTSTAMGASEAAAAGCTGNTKTLSTNTDTAVVAGTALVAAHIIRPEGDTAAAGVLEDVMDVDVNTGSPDPTIKLHGTTAAGTATMAAPHYSSLRHQEQQTAVPKQLATFTVDEQKDEGQAFCAELNVPGYRGLLECSDTNKTDAISRLHGTAVAPAVMVNMPSVVHLSSTGPADGRPSSATVLKQASMAASDQQPEAMVAATTQFGEDHGKMESCNAVLHTATHTSTFKMEFSFSVAGFGPVADRQAKAGPSRSACGSGDSPLETLDPSTINPDVRLDVQADGMVGMQQVPALGSNGHGEEVLPMVARNHHTEECWAQQLQQQHHHQKQGQQQECCSLANDSVRDEGSESSAAMAVVDRHGEGPNEAQALLEAEELQEPTLLDWRSLVLRTPDPGENDKQVGYPVEGGQPRTALDWRDLVSEYSTCSYSQPNTLEHEQQLQEQKPEQEPEQKPGQEQHPSAPQPAVQEQVAPKAWVGSAAGTWTWAKISNPVLQAPFLEQEVIPYQEMRFQLPRLMSDLQMIPTLPLQGFQMRLAASEAERPELEVALAEAAQELGFFWSVWGLDTAPDRLDGIQVLVLSKSAVSEISTLRGLIIKAIAVHPIQLYRAEVLVRGLQLLAREVRGGGVGSVKRTLEGALQLAHSSGGVPSIDCLPLYPARVVVLLDAQAFLKTPPPMLTQLMGCLVAGSDTWGQPWQLQMRASDIAIVESTGSQAHRNVLARALGPACCDRGDGGVLKGSGAAAAAAEAAGAAPHREASPQKQPVLRPLDADSQSSSTEVVVFKDATRLMHLQRPGRLVIAAFSEEEDAQYSKKGRKSKNVLSGTVREVVSFLDLMLQHRWAKQEGF